jgi:hypothetical protein
MNKEEDKSAKPLGSVNKEWGKIPDDHFGYDSDEDRLNKRGMEDWELVEHIPKSQKGTPKWFIAVIFMVLLMAFGLTMPFWGDRPDNPRPWFTWGHIAALVYFAVAAVFIRFMVNLYGSDAAGRLDSDTENNHKDELDEAGFPK